MGSAHLLPPFPRAAKAAQTRPGRAGGCHRRILACGVHGVRTSFAAFSSRGGGDGGRDGGGLGAVPASEARSELGPGRFDVLGFAGARCARLRFAAAAVSPGPGDGRPDGNGRLGVKQQP